MIIRDIYLESVRVFEPIKIVEGTNNQVIRFNVKDFTMISGTTCYAYSKTHFATYKVECVVNTTDNYIELTAPSGFFLEGMCELQLEIITNPNASVVKTYTYVMAVVCDKNLFNDTVRRAEEIDPTEEMVANYIYVRTQVELNKDDIADIKEAIENVNSGIEVTEEQYEAIRASSEYDPEATYFINDVDSPEKEVYLTRAQYNALRQTSEYSPSTKYYITDEDGVVGAEAVSYGDGSVADELGNLSEAIGRRVIHATEETQLSAKSVASGSPNVLGSENISDGAYMVTCSATFQSTSASGTRKVELLFNNAVIGASSVEVPASASGYITISTVPRVFVVGASPIPISLRVTQSSGGTMNVSGYITKTKLFG